MVSVAVIAAPAVAAAIAAVAFAAFPAALAAVTEFESCLLGWHSSFVAMLLLPEAWPLEHIFAERQYSRVISRRSITSADGTVLIY